MSLGPPELLLILLIVVLLFGATKLPKLARSLGEAKREFEAGTTDKPGPPQNTTDSTEPKKSA